MKNIERTVSVTFKMFNSEILSFESWFRQQQEVISLRILPETETMYEEDKTFQRLVKDVKKANKARDIYINDNLYKYDKPLK